MLSSSNRKKLNILLHKNSRISFKPQVSVILTFELVEDTDGFDDVAWVGKNLNDVVLHGAHHTEARLLTCSRRKRLRRMEGTRMCYLEVTDMTWSAPATACDWLMEACMWDTAGPSWGSRCSPCSGDRRRCGEPGSTSGWVALEGTGSFGGARFHHCY